MNLHESAARRCGYVYLRGLVRSCCKSCAVVDANNNPRLLPQDVSAISPNARLHANLRTLHGTRRRAACGSIQCQPVGLHATLLEEVGLTAQGMLTCANGVGMHRASAHPMCTPPESAELQARPLQARPVVCSMINVTHRARTEGIASQCELWLAVYD